MRFDNLSASLTELARVHQTWAGIPEPRLVSFGLSERSIRRMQRLNSVLNLPLPSNPTDAVETLFTAYLMHLEKLYNLPSIDQVDNVKEPIELYLELYPPIDQVDRPAPPLRSLEDMAFGDEKAERMGL